MAVYYFVFFSEPLNQKLISYVYEREKEPPEVVALFMEAVFVPFFSLTPAIGLVIINSYLISVSSKGERFCVRVDAGSERTLLPSFGIITP